MTVLVNESVSATPTLPLPLPLPLRPNLRLYVENANPVVAAAYGTVVADPAAAGLAIIRNRAPFDHRDELFFERSSRQGSLAFQPELPARLSRLAEQVPIVVDVFLDRPVIPTLLIPIVSARTATYGYSGHAYFQAITGEIAPEGRLLFEIPGRWSPSWRPQMMSRRTKSPRLSHWVWPGTLVSRLSTRGL